ncbi:hypothetical protein [Pseudomonas sp.]|jgi:hypothetical protein|uniref:hypothetical protein n=1 Tax=unclassified Pseudomonas TaxID=196821 RepID=UPI002ED81E5B
MKIQKGALAPTAPACPKKATELFYVSHPKVVKALLGPFLCAADAECGRQVMRNQLAVVTSGLAESIDEFTYWRAINNGQVCRAFAGRIANE